MTEIYDLVNQCDWGVHGQFFLRIWFDCDKSSNEHLYCYPFIIGLTTGYVECSSLWQASSSPLSMPLYSQKLIGLHEFFKLGRSPPDDHRLSLLAHSLSFVPWWSPFRFDYFFLLSLLFHVVLYCIWLYPYCLPLTNIKSCQDSKCNITRPCPNRNNQDCLTAFVRN